MSGGGGGGGVPSTLIGRSVFCVKQGMLVGFHMKSTSSLAVSVTQEPLRVALGTFRLAQLGELTKSAPSHLPTLVRALSVAFEAGDTVELINPASPDVVADFHNRHTAQGMTLVGEDEGELPPPATGVRVRFVAFSTEYDITLALKSCPDDAKDPFAWSMIMDLYRTMLRAQAQLRSPPSAPPRSPGNSPPKASSSRGRGGAHTARVAASVGTDVKTRPVSSRTAAGPAPLTPAAPQWRGVNTSRGHSLHDVGLGDAPSTIQQEPAAAATTVGSRPGRRVWSASLSSTAPRGLLQRELLSARQKLAETVAREPAPRAPPRRVEGQGAPDEDGDLCVHPDVRCVGVDTTDLEPATPNGRGGSQRKFTSSGNASRRRSGGGRRSGPTTPKAASSAGQQGPKRGSLSSARERTISGKRMMAVAIPRVDLNEALPADFDEDEALLREYEMLAEHHATVAPNPQPPPS